MIDWLIVWQKEFSFKVGAEVQEKMPPLAAEITFICFASGKSVATPSNYK